MTWIHVERPTFDIVGVILSSLGLTALLAAIAVVIGALIALWLIRSRSRRGAEPGEHLVRLRLSSRERND